MCALLSGLYIGDDHEGDGGGGGGRLAKEGKKCVFNSSISSMHQLSAFKVKTGLLLEIYVQKVLLFSHQCIFVTLR